MQWSDLEVLLYYSIQIYKGNISTPLIQSLLTYLTGP